MLRTLWYREVTQVWFAFLEATAWRRKQVRLDPGLAEKLHRPYRRSDLSAAGRLTAAISHWQALESCNWKPVAQQWSGRPVLLARILAKDEATFEPVLCTARQFAKEGDVCLQLRSDAATLFTAAFSLRPEGQATSKALLVEVGCLQGPGGEAGRRLVRETTKLLQGLRPRDLLVQALRSIALALDATGIVGVCQERHVYRHWRKRRQCAFDYDAYWLEQQGYRRSDGDFALPIRVPAADLSRVPSRKRAEVRRRQGLQAQMHEDILAALVSPAKVLTQVGQHRFEATPAPSFGC